MQSMKSAQVFSPSTLPVSRTRRTALAATRGDRNAVNEPARRSVLLGVAGMGLFWFGDAMSVDVESPRKVKEREAALAAAAEESKVNRIGKSVFGNSKYAMAEDKTPNIHRRQVRGKLNQVNA